MVEIEGEDDVEPLNKAANPRLPSAADVEEHNRTHIPYRSWCKWCVEGRGRGGNHHPSHGSSVPVVGIDYFFITSGGVVKRDELEYALDAAGEEQLFAARAQGSIVKCIVARCFNSKNVFAHCVPCKGADEEGYVADLVVKDITWLGHSELIVKGDNEPALQALIQRALEVLRISTSVEKISDEQSPAYDSQSNGGTEVGVMLIRGLFRTLRLGLEAAIGKRIPVDHAVIPWLLEHTALLLSIRTRLPNGMTPWAMSRGRPFGQKIIGFGERVLWKLPTKGPNSQPDGNMGARWQDGVFVGYNRSSNTFIVLTEDGKKSVRSINRYPEQTRWSADVLAKIKATPWSERETADPVVRFQELVTDRTGTEVSAPGALKKFQDQRTRSEDPWIH